MRVKRLRGMTLVELMVSMAIMLLLTFFMFGVALQSGQIITQTEDSGTVLAKARAAYQQMSQHMSESDAALTQYPPSGAATYQADRSTTLILRVPRPNGSGVIVAGNYDVFIYRIEATTGMNGPFTLKRYKGVITSGTAAAATLDKNLANRIGSLSMDFGALETQFGDYAKTVFTMEGTPESNTNQIKTQVLVGGVDRLVDNMASISGRNVTFALPPRALPIDISYRVSPTVITGDFAKNAAKFAYVKLVAKPKWQTRNGVQKERDLVLYTRMTMRD